METSTPVAKHDEQTYEEFEPLCKLQKHDEENDILQIHLPGFKRQDIRVRFNEAGILTISGKQGGNADKNSTPMSTASRFEKDVKISGKCRAEQIRAKFSHGVLSITVPKQVVNLSKKSAEDFEHSARSLLGLQATVLRPRMIRKATALKLVAVSAAMVLAGFGIYKLCTILDYM